MKNEHNKDSLSGFWFIVSNAVPPIGFFLYLKHRKRFPNKARRALTSAVIGVPIAVIVGFIMNNYILK
ncbi:hypothetical protein SAMN05421664_3265 [Chryseobacterium soldanellicola]|uniref:Uncharacterized protein n=1 Tax=Chryseobacterium soldanellicola TaxID=311333 RepID=A0A1H1FU84_9FLAO|nr:hypothetical protein [Chryseobacterium soldanellicola]SDR04441.1 hypothetical protein SAMN05421664_3265 [Chryseobacterium soldanellicola]